jgi:cysteine synthase A
MTLITDRRDLLIGLVSGSILSIVSTGALFYYFYRSTSDAPTTPLTTIPPARNSTIVEGVDGLIGNTPLMKIRSLSEATGCTILVS